MSRKPASGSVTFFIDASLGGRLVAQALRDPDARVEVHNDHFAEGTPDVEWLATVGVRAFFLAQQGLTGAEMAKIFADAHDGMVNRATSQPAPFIYTYIASGEVLAGQ